MARNNEQIRKIVNMFLMHSKMYTESIKCWQVGNHSAEQYSRPKVF